MLKRKEKVGKRQFYRRIACNVQTILNEIVCDDKKQSQNVSNIKETISCDNNCDVDSQKSRNVTEVFSYNNSDVNVLLDVEKIHLLIIIICLITQLLYLTNVLLILT